MQLENKTLEVMKKSLEFCGSDCFRYSWSSDYCNWIREVYKAIFSISKSPRRDDHSVFDSVGVENVQ